METTRRRWLLPAAALAVIAVVAFATCRSDESAPQHAERATPDAAKPPPPHKSRRGAEAPGAGPAAGGAKDSASSEQGQVPEDDGYPFIDVEVVKHDGTPASNAAIVYALHAQGSIDVEPPNVNVDDGTCRLHVLRAGNYDIGAVDGAFAALATDVGVPHDGALRITLPAPAEVVLLADPPLVPGDAAWPGAQFHVEASAENVAAFPGRGQQVRWTLGGRFEQDTRSFGVVVAKGATGRVRFESRDVAAVPAAFTAPATLHVVRAGRYPLTLRLAFESPGTSFPHAAALQADFVVGDVAESAARWAQTLAANQAIGAVLTRPVELSTNASAPEGTITWKGSGVVPGSQAFSGLALGAANVVDLTLRLEPDPPERFPWDAPAPGPGFDTMVKLRAATGDDTGLPSKIWLFFCDTAGYRIATEQLPGEDIPMTGPAGGWLVATRGSWTADPVRLGAGPATDGTTMTLRPGGWLVVALDRRPPQSLGPITLRRRDGAPFLTQDGALIVFAAGAVEGAVLGPFPDGGVDFVLELSGETVREIHANVRAGAREKLRIPSLARR